MAGASAGVSLEQGGGGSVIQEGPWLKPLRSIGLDFSSQMAAAPSDPQGGALAQMRPAKEESKRSRKRVFQKGAREAGLH